MQRIHVDNAAERTNDPVDVSGAPLTKRTLSLVVAQLAPGGLRHRCARTVVDFDHAEVGAAVHHSVAGGHVERIRGQRPLSAAAHLGDHIRDSDRLRDRSDRRPLRRRGHGVFLFSPITVRGLVFGNPVGSWSLSLSFFAREGTKCRLARMTGVQIWVPEKGEKFSAK